MELVAWPAALVGVLPWLGLPLLLMATVTSTAVVRLGFGAVLCTVLALFYLSVCQVLPGPGWPIWIEGLFLWGPTTLAVCGAAMLTERWLSRRRNSGSAPGSDAPGVPAVAGRRMSLLLAASFAGWSACCGGCAFSPAAEFVDLRLDSPTPGLVLPMPKGLTLVSAERECGSAWCSEIYLIGSPDHASQPELTGRLWAHLSGAKGWQRLREDAGCQRPGWFLRNEFCLFVDTEQPGPDARIRVHVTGDLTVA